MDFVSRRGSEICRGERPKLKRFEILCNGIIPVTVGALAWRVFVDHDLLVTELFSLDVALRTGQIGVAAGQSEVSARFVIEGRRRPAQ